MATTRRDDRSCTPAWAAYGMRDAIVLLAGFALAPVPIGAAA